MCGIVGYTGPREAIEILFDALKRLEYRGYDSAGLAILENDIQIVKDKGDISQLERSVSKLRGTLGIGHTRWATCGKPSKENAHPFLDCSGNFAVVHNGIIENHRELRRELEAEGHVFTSETDTEVLVHLIEKYYDGNMEKAVREALKRVKGTYAVAVIGKGSKEIIAARKENPLVVGLGVGENFIASDVTALLNYTNKVIHVMDGEYVVISPAGVRLYDCSGNEISRAPSLITWTVEDAQRGGFEHYMLKEIFEQPASIHNSLLGMLDGIEEGEFLRDANFDSVKIVGCGSSYHAAMVGKYIIESLAHIPVTLELASEYRYSHGTRETPLVILITQSGETADTLAAAREAKKRGCRTFAITNVVGSTITREVDEVFYTKAGPEIGVAATKSYITQLIALYLVGMRIGFVHRTISHELLRSMKDQLRLMPRQVSAVLDNKEIIEGASDLLVNARNVFFIGRNINYPTMLEGALKLKEISYIHAEGYAAGELKHGPLALLDRDTPVVASCIKDHTYEKMISNISEVAARDSPILAIGYEDDRELMAIADRFIGIPKVDPLFSPVPLTVVLQLLAYYTARKRGCPIDKPRNLAKSVTVE
ncbi:MAG: glutamine--fructose-6-phosphate transaminase (isomerizing) [Methanomassiliicoccales archaeon]|jgi:glucosamine--fructose-6-phosphate aminotransferase (isomerizing)|nr:glutamine--fructose-6-phosphate transaminase (isomerizing) [Methanomassiliicoccales archaeon]